MIDTHIHSVFSIDSEESVERIAERATKLGLDYFSICDHVDIDYPSSESAPMTDFIAYFDIMQSVRQLYPQSYCGIGVELGFAETAALVAKRLTTNYPFDYVINSVHVVDGKDCFSKEYFEGKDRATAYTRYLEEVLKSLDVDYYYSAVGHLGYIARKAPYANPALKYVDHAEILDAILEKIIKKEKILEINTRTEQCGAKMFPSEDILGRYKELGGELITFGSDAHKAQDIGKNYEQAAKTALALGFQSFAVCKSRRIELVPIEK